MALPKRRHSRSRARKRRTHNKISIPGSSLCVSCGEVTYPHRACPNCGYYKGRTFKKEEEAAPEE